MVFAYKTSENIFKSLWEDPVYFNSLLNFDYNGFNVIGYNKEQMSLIINDFDNEGHLYCGGNLFHVLSKIVGKNNTEDYTEDVLECDQYLAIDIFENMRHIGGNPYHYILEYQNVLDTAILSKKTDKTQYINFLNNFYLNNQPIFNNITLSDNVLHKSYDFIKNLLRNSDDTLFKYLGGENYWKYFNLSDDNKEYLIYDLAKHYVINEKYDNIKNLSEIIVNIL